MHTIFGPNVMFTPDTEQVKSMYEQDNSLALLGITITKVEPNHTEGEMTITKEMCNGFDTIQGGILFTFADALFAGACNTTTATPTVASQVNIHFIAPGKIGTTLRGVARQTQTWGRNVLTDVTIYDGERAIAEFRGMSRTTSRPPTEK